MFPFVGSLFLLLALVVNDGKDKQIIYLSMMVKINNLTVSDTKIYTLTMRDLNDPVN